MLQSHPRGPEAAAVGPRCSRCLWGIRLARRVGNGFSGQADPLETQPGRLGDRSLLYPIGTLVLSGGVGAAQRGRGTRDSQKTGNLLPEPRPCHLHQESQNESKTTAPAEGVPTVRSSPWMEKGEQGR